MNRLELESGDPATGLVEVIDLEALNSARVLSQSGSQQPVSGGPPSAEAVPPAEPLGNAPSQQGNYAASHDADPPRQPPREENRRYHSDHAHDHGHDHGAGFDWEDTAPAGFSEAFLCSKRQVGDLFSRTVVYHLQDQSESPVVRYHHDQRELDMLLPRHDTSQRYAATHHAFVGLRYVQFQNGPLLVGWCNGGPCQQSTATGPLDLLLKDCDIEDSTAEAFFLVPGSAPPMYRHAWCSCCAAALAALGGHAALQQLLEVAVAAPGPDQEPIVFECHSSRSNTKYIAVRAGGAFCDWGLVEWAEVRPTCRTCRRNRGQCRHIKLLVDPESLAGLQPSGLSPEDFEKKLRKVIDPTTGLLKITSISQHVLCEELEDDPALQAIYKGTCPHCSL